LRGIVDTMRKLHKLLLVICIIILAVLPGCGKKTLVQGNSTEENGGKKTVRIPGGENAQSSPGGKSSPVVAGVEPEDPTEGEKKEVTDEEGGIHKEEGIHEGSAPKNGDAVSPDIDLSSIRPNEAGKIMIVMFHNFIESYKSGDKEWTTTFDAFRELLDTLYSRGYRLISMRDYLDNNISVAAGCIPMVFTFDDGTPGQFNLVKENGKLTVNAKSAVGVMKEFNNIHPDFGLKGVFYVNLGLGAFQGEGTLSERLNYLTDMGFEIGNHTMSHVYLSEIKNADIIQKEIGGNQKIMYELMPGYVMETFSLPFGLPAKDLQKYVAEGEYENVRYKQAAIMEVGWDPAFSPVNKNFNPLSVHRVRSPGLFPVDCDLTWWLERLSREEQYISDGNPDTVTVPESKKDAIDMGKLKGKKFVVY
jgi:peptidoglycan/xylan/chitin deacetylase (PgdA/CDA1 family)